jgi:hypothetical protein
VIVIKIVDQVYPTIVSSQIWMKKKEDWLTPVFNDCPTFSSKRFKLVSFTLARSFF